MSALEGSESPGQIGEPLSEELADIQQSPASEYEQYVVDCVTSEGFDYLPLSARVDVEAELADDEREFREEHGFGYAIPFEDRTTVQMRADAAAENADERYHAMSDDEQLEYFSLVAACDQQAFVSYGYSPLTIMPVTHADWPDAEAEVRPRVESDDDYVEQSEQWRSCMDEHAYDPGPPELVSLNLEDQTRDLYDAYIKAGDIIVQQDAGTWQTFTAEGLLSEDDFEELQLLQWEEREIADADLLCREEGHDPLTLYNELFSQFMLDELELEIK